MSSNRLSRNSKIVYEIPLNRSNKAKRIRFYHNGNKFFNGVVVPVSTDRYRSFDSLKTDLTNILKEKVILQHGLQNIYTMGGRKISSINELEDGRGYVCSGKGETFKKIEYTDLPQEKTWQISTSKIITPIDTYVPKTARIPKCVSPRFIIVIRNGITPRRIFRVFLNKRNALTMDQVLKVLTDSAHLDTGAVRKIFTESGRLIRKLEDIFDCLNEVFFVYGSEKYRHEDFKLTTQENNALDIQKKMIRGQIG